MSGFINVSGLVSGDSNTFSLQLPHMLYSVSLQAPWLCVRKIIFRKVIVKKASDNQTLDLNLVDPQKSLNFVQALRHNVLCCAVEASFQHYLRSEQKTRENHLAPLKCLFLN